MLRRTGVSIMPMHFPSTLMQATVAVYTSGIVYASNFLPSIPRCIPISFSDIRRLGQGKVNLLCYLAKMASKGGGAFELKLGKSLKPKGFEPISKKTPRQRASGQRQARATETPA